MGERRVDVHIRLRGSQSDRRLMRARLESAGFIWPEEIAPREMNIVLTRIVYSAKQAAVSLVVGEIADALASVVSYDLVEARLITPRANSYEEHLVVPAPGAEWSRRSRRVFNMFTATGLFGRHWWIRTPRGVIPEPRGSRLKSGQPWDAVRDRLRVRVGPMPHGHDSLRSAILSVVLVVVITLGLLAAGFWIDSWRPRVLGAAIGFLVCGFVVLRPWDASIRRRSGWILAGSGAGLLVASPFAWHARGVLAESFAPMTWVLFLAAALVGSWYIGSYLTSNRPRPGAAKVAVGVLVIGLLIVLGAVLRRALPEASTLILLPIAGLIVLSAAGWWHLSRDGLLRRARTLISLVPLVVSLPFLADALWLLFFQEFGIPGGEVSVPTAVGAVMVIWSLGRFVVVVLVLGAMVGWIRYWGVLRRQEGMNVALLACISLAYLLSALGAGVSVVAQQVEAARQVADERSPTGLGAFAFDRVCVTAVDSARPQYGLDVPAHPVLMARYTTDRMWLWDPRATDLSSERRSIAILREEARVLPADEGQTTCPG